MKFYAVVVGRKVGVYTDWEECKKQINGYSGAQFKSFFSRDEAEDYIDQRLKRPKKTPESNKVRELPLHNKTKLYTDGSAKDDQGGYGLRVIYPNGEIVEDYDIVPTGPNGETPTNQRAELFAIKRGLEITEGDLVVYSDSMYSIKCMTEWIDGWQRNGWRNARGNQVVNQDLIKEIYRLMQGRQITYMHVPAHSGIVNNERVDRLANMGRLGRTSI